MKQKKETLASRASALLADNPTMKPKEMAEKLGVTTQRIYVLRSNLKKKLTKKVVTNVHNKRRGRPAKVETLQRISRPVNYLLNLEHENQKLTEWTLLWKQKYEKLEQDYTQAKVMFLNSQAVVEYLENKVANLITINNLKGN
jgi:predicted ArsR family transcriptional regulator